MLSTDATGTFLIQLFLKGWPPEASLNKNKKTPVGCSGRGFDQFDVRL